MKRHRKVDGKSSAYEQGFVHLIRLPWTGQSGHWWNESCADIMEVFGLPGSRFVSHPTPDYMDFYFKSERDKELCKILLSEKITTFT
jgi:hypothetical protein